MSVLHINGVNHSNNHSSNLKKKRTKTSFTYGMKTKKEQNCSAPGNKSKIEIAVKGNKYCLYDEKLKFHCVVRIK